MVHGVSGFAVMMGRPMEIRITPEMIEAGLSVSWRLESDDDPERLVRDIYRAMREVAVDSQARSVVRELVEE